MFSSGLHGAFVAFVCWDPGSVLNAFFNRMAAANALTDVGDLFALWELVSVDH